MHVSSDRPPSYSESCMTTCTCNPFYFLSSPFSICLSSLLLLLFDRFHFPRPVYPILGP